MPVAMESKSDSVVHFQIKDEICIFFLSCIQTHASAMVTTAAGPVGVNAEMIQTAAVKPA